MLHRLWRLRWVRVSVWIAAALLAELALETMPVRWRSSYTCLHCRTQKADEQWIFSTRSEIEENRFSNWFNSHYPPHEHQWVFLGGGSYSVSGARLEWRCSSNPFVDFAPWMELVMAENAPEEFAAFYQSMVRSSRAEQRDIVERAALRAGELWRGLPRGK